MNADIAYAVRRSVALGSKYGLRAIPMFSDPNVETPYVSEDAFVDGAIGIVVTLAGTMIALYICILVVGSMSKTTASSIPLTAAWNSSMSALDTNSQASFSLAGILPIAIVGVGVLVIIISAFSMR